MCFRQSCMGHCIGEAEEPFKTDIEAEKVRECVNGWNEALVCKKPQIQVNLSKEVILDTSVLTFWFLSSQTIMTTHATKTMWIEHWTSDLMQLQWKNTPWFTRGYQLYAADKLENCFFCIWLVGVLVWISLLSTGDLLLDDSKGWWRCMILLLEHW